jgi:hypothetical protein
MNNSEPKITQVLREAGVDIDTTHIDPTTGLQDTVVRIAERMLSITPPILSPEHTNALGELGISALSR